MMIIMLRVVCRYVGLALFVVSFVAVSSALIPNANASEWDFPVNDELVAHHFDFVASDKVSKDTSTLSGVELYKHLAETQMQKRNKIKNYRDKMYDFQRRKYNYLRDKKRVQ